MIRALARLVRPPQPTTLVNAEGGYVRIEGAPCKLTCAFCVGGVLARQAAQSVASEPLCARRRRFGPLLDRINPMNELRRRRATANAAQRKRQLLAEIDALLHGTPPQDRVELTADDLLELDGILEVFALFKRHDRCLTVNTPGLRLADPAFARAVKAYPLHFILTVVAATRETTTAIQGNPEAHDALRRAMKNLTQLDIPFSINCVLTRLNVGELAQLGTYLLEEVGLSGFTIPSFYLEQTLLDVDPQASQLYAPFPEVDQQLRQLVGVTQKSDKRIYLVDLPPCQLSEPVLANPRFHWQFVTHTDSPTPNLRDPACDGCVLDHRCGHLPSHYLREFPDTTVDPTLVNRHLGQPRRGDD